MDQDFRANVNGYVYDLNDGGAICHVCDKHLHNCAEHTTEELEGEQHANQEIQST